jgi:hypothetical protein
LIGDRFFLASHARCIAEEAMPIHISLSKHGCLHDLLVISLGKIRQFDPKYFPIAAERDIRRRGARVSPTPRRRLRMFRPLLVFIAELDMRVGRVAFFHEPKHSFDMPKSTRNTPTMRTHAQAGDTNRRREVDVVPP